MKKKVLFGICVVCLFSMACGKQTEKTETSEKETITTDLNIETEETVDEKTKEQYMLTDVDFSDLHNPMAVMKDLQEVNDLDYILVCDIYQEDYAVIDEYGMLREGDIVNSAGGHPYEVSGFDRSMNSDWQRVYLLNHETGGEFYMDNDAGYTYENSEGKHCYTINEMETGFPVYVTVYSDCRLLFSAYARSCPLVDGGGLKRDNPSIVYREEKTTQKMDPRGTTLEVYDMNPNQLWACDIDVNLYNPFSIELDENNEIIYLEEQYRP